MKKIIISVLLFLLIALSYNCIYATSGHYKVSINKVTEKAIPGEEFKVYVAISDFNNVGDGINAATGKISYNSNVLEVKSVETSSGWDRLNSSSLKTDYKPTNDEKTQWTSLTTNDKIISFATTGNTTKSNFNLLTITFKVLDIAKNGDKANIKILYLDLANEEDFDEEILPTFTIFVGETTNEYNNIFNKNIKMQIARRLRNSKRIETKIGNIKFRLYVPITIAHNYI